MGKFIKDNIHWIVIVVGVIAIVAYYKATAEPEDSDKKDPNGETK